MIGIALLAAATDASVSTSTPVALVRTLYAEEQRSLRNQGLPPWHRPERWFDARLSKLFRADARRAERDDIGNLQFDPLCDGQDCRISAVKAFCTATNGSQATVHVRFRNFGKARLLVFAMRRTGKGWRIAEISGLKHPRWQLSAVLRGSDR